VLIHREKAGYFILLSNCSVYSVIVLWLYSSVPHEGNPCSFDKSSPEDHILSTDIFRHVSSIFILLKMIYTVNPVEFLPKLIKHFTCSDPPGAGWLSQLIFLSVCTVESIIGRLINPRGNGREDLRLFGDYSSSSLVSSNVRTMDITENNGKILLM
jgi:hypothetical protein